MFQARKQKLASRVVIHEIEQYDDNLYFRGVDNQLALRKRYKDLLKIYHPDNLDGDARMAVAIKETFESVINMDSNTYINRLTIWNIVLMVPSVIVGYYGMNMDLPYASHAHTALVIFIAIMVLLTGYGL